MNETFANETAGQPETASIQYGSGRLTVKVTLQANASIPTRQARGQLSVRVIRGHVQMQTLGRTFDMHEGRLVALNCGIPHAINAIEPSTLLMTIAWSND